ITGRFGVHLSAQQKIYIGGIDGPILTTDAGPVQTVFTAYLTLSTDGAVGVSFTSGYKQTLAAQCQIDTTTAGSSGDSGGPQAGTSLFASMNVQTGVQLGASLQLWWLAGPEVTLTPYLQLTASPAASPWWDLSLGADVGVAVTAGQAWGPGETLYENSSLLTQTIEDIAHASGAFSGLVITPNPVSLQTGVTQQFHATLIQGGISSSPSVTWSVPGGPGTIDSSGNYVSSQGGPAVIEADAAGTAARAGVIVS